MALCALRVCTGRKRTVHEMLEEPVAAAPSHITPSAGANNGGGLDEFPELLRAYYARLFPFQQFCTWLGYDNLCGSAENAAKVMVGTYFSRRELSFTLADETYIRYQSFTGPDELRKELLRLCPVKIDIGAVFNHQPKEHKTLTASAFAPLEKELVFDVDMTDYDDIRTCCSGAAICEKCWQFMTIAVQIVDHALRSDFGFQHILWVYSGRRGVHAWVCDARARALSNEARTAIVEYLSVFRKNADADRRVFLGQPLHPGFDAALELLNELFPEQMLRNQRLFSSAEQWDKFLPLITSTEVREMVRVVLQRQAGDNPEGVWAGIQELYSAEARRQYGTRESDLAEIVFNFGYPRLDVNVSKGLNHLLKAPFCVHPKTGRVCVPFDPARVASFSPFTVPTIGQLIAELGAAPPGENGASDALARTSLAPYMDFFENTFLRGLGADLRKQRAALAHEAPLSAVKREPAQLKQEDRKSVV